MSCWLSAGSGPPDVVVLVGSTSTGWDESGRAGLASVGPSTWSSTGDRSVGLGRQRCSMVLTQSFPNSDAAAAPYTADYHHHHQHTGSSQPLPHQGFDADDVNHPQRRPHRHGSGQHSLTSSSLSNEQQLGLLKQQDYYNNASSLSHHHHHYCPPHRQASDTSAGVAVVATTSSSSSGSSSASANGVQVTNGHGGGGGVAAAMPNIAPSTTAYRDPTTAPLRKLSVDLIKTYKHINEVGTWFNMSLLSGELSTWCYCDMWHQVGRVRGERLNSSWNTPRYMNLTGSLWALLIGTVLVMKLCFVCLVAADTDIVYIAQYSYQTWPLHYSLDELCTLSPSPHGSWLLVQPSRPSCVWLNLECSTETLFFFVWNHCERE